MDAYCLSVVLSHAGEKTTDKEETYHAAVRPEPASPELVEGSKGRRKLRLSKFK